MEDITDADYAHARKVCKDFEVKYLGEYHDLCIESNAIASWFIWKLSKYVS